MAFGVENAGLNQRQDRDQAGKDMTIQITGKNVDAGNAYQSYVADKIRVVLQKYIGRDVDRHIRLEKKRGGFKTSCAGKLASGLLL